MIPATLAALGVGGLVAGWLLLRSLGIRYRVGRLLAVTPRVSVDEAVRLAADAASPYVRIDGRIDAEEEFEDANHRPLVFRRTTFEAQVGRRWTIVENGLETVPFDVREGLSAIGVDAAALGAGLVVIPRESRGIAADAADRVPPELPGDTLVRVSIEQLSSVDHATVLGVPTIDAGGAPHLTAGRGRPLILTNLESADAMRILVGDRRLVPVAATACFVAGLVFLLGSVASSLLGIR